MIILIMGVSGCGKTTLGETVARKMGVSYYEADSFHPEANIRKMASGTPLTDADRWPWLTVIREHMNTCLNEGRSAVFSCSALKESYRRYLVDGLAEAPRWVYLKGDFQTIHGRLEQRSGHYQKAEMLKSQFADLEEPEYGLILDITMTPQEMGERVLEWV